MTTDALSLPSAVDEGQGVAGVRALKFPVLRKIAYARLMAMKAGRVLVAPRDVTLGCTLVQSDQTVERGAEKWPVIHVDPETVKELIASPYVYEADVVHNARWFGSSSAGTLYNEEADFYKMDVDIARHFVVEWGACSCMPQSANAGNPQPVESQEGSAKA